MRHTPPKVTIDLAEYQELLETKKKYDNPESEISQSEFREIMAHVLVGVPEHELKYLIPFIQQEFNVKMVVSSQAGKPTVDFVKQAL